MMRSLADEVIRRRLWPIPLAALLIIIAGPLLFMKSAPSNAPAADAAPAAAKPGTLPTSAAKLVTTSDKAVTPRHKATGSQDPFAPPASAIAAAAKANAPAAAASTSSATATKAKSPATLHVVVTDKTKNKVATKKSSKPKSTTPAPAPAPAVKTTNIAKPFSKVRVRFGDGNGDKVQRVSRMQPLLAGNEVVAMFVKYSPVRNKAVFAVAPSTQVAGDVACRIKAGVCRYVDIPAGKHVVFTLRKADGSIVSRRLDVVSVGKVTKTIADVTAPTVSSPAHTNAIATATCLLKSLLALPAILPSISVNACD